MPSTEKAFAITKGASSQATRGRPRGFDTARALDVAMEVFWRKGYMQTTLADLCQAMDIKAPSFYCAFKTRSDLFLQTISHYKKVYWHSVLKSLEEDENIYSAIRDFFIEAVKIFMRPNLPKGCFMDISTVGLPNTETRILDTLTRESQLLNNLFRKRLMKAVEAGQIPADSDIPAITGSLIAFLKGISVMARGDICQAELTAIAMRALVLLPQARTTRVRS